MSALTVHITTLYVALAQAGVRVRAAQDNVAGVKIPKFESIKEAQDSKMGLIGLGRGGKQIQTARYGAALEVLGTFLWALVQRVSVCCSLQREEALMHQHPLNCTQLCLRLLPLVAFPLCGNYYRHAKLLNCRFDMYSCCSKLPLPSVPPPNTHTGSPSWTPWTCWLSWPACRPRS